MKSFWGLIPVPSLFLHLLSSSSLAYQPHEHRRLQPLSTDGLDPYTPSTPLLIPRASSSGSYACDKNTPCPNGACCGGSGYCGYGPTFCGSGCVNDCDAKAECGQFASNPGQTCPLNVCCSQHGFCGTTPDFCGSGCQSGCTQPKSGASSGHVQRRITGYYQSWSIGVQCMDMNPNQIPVNDLTHLNYAFGYIDSNFNIGPMPGADASTFSDITDLKSQNPALIVSISLGGWSFNDNGTDTQDVFWKMVSSETNRQTFITNLLAFMNHYAFDGVDIDWEYPGAPDRQPNQSGNTTVDGENYTKLLTEIKSAFQGHATPKYLSFTAPTSYWYLRWFPIGEMVKNVDYINFMTYDLHGVWDANNPIGTQVLAHTNLTEVSLSLDLLWRNGVDPAKVNLGLAFYSRTFTLKDTNCTSPGCPFKGGGLAGACTKNSGTLSYKEITEVLADTGVTPTYDDTNAVKYFTWHEDQWASYDDVETLQQKIQFANNQGIGGLVIWSVDQDDSNFDALRGLIYPDELQTVSVANNVSYWESQHPGACKTTTCGGSCSPGTIEITKMPCGKGGTPLQKLCCPLTSAPDPSTCTWSSCNGQCHGGEVALTSSTEGGTGLGHCSDGLHFYCCPIPEVADGSGINCGWQEKCRSDQTLLTFAGTFLEDIDPVLRFSGLVGEALADALDQLDIKEEKRYCCGNEEAENWKNCYWAGTTGKGPNNCDDNHCSTGIEVELTTSYFGDGESCTPQFRRQRAFCCTPSSGQSPFLPVPLENLFPHAPPSDIVDPIFNLEVDDSWGTGKVEGADDPNDASFGFVVITAPDEVQVSLNKRDGSPWEVFDCIDDQSEEAQTVRMICTDYTEDTRCNDIHRGHGAPGTIVEMPLGCGPGKYGVVKRMEASKDQSLPHHLHKRNLKGTVYDLTFDYDFRRVPRAFGDSLMRVDMSNEEGYWDSVVDRPGSKKMKRSEVHEFRRNRKRYLEEEWRNAYHFGGLDRDELHKRWFGSDVLAWLKNLVTTGQASVTNEYHHTVSEDLSIILIDQQFGPCPVGPASLAGNVKATLDAHVQIDTSFGLTIIATLGFPPDLSKSYLYFKNDGQITASFQLTAVATLSYTSGDVKMIGLDSFPGATFRVPGIVTVGPNLAVFGRVDAALTVAGRIEAKAELGSWQIQQTYPQNSAYPATDLKQVDLDGTQSLGSPSFDASVTANGEITMHLKPEVEFGIVFDSRWQVPDCSAVLALDAYVILHAQASASLNGDNSCPFSYGVDGGAHVYAQLNAPEIFGWGDNQQFNLGPTITKSLVPETCIGGSSNSRRGLYDPTGPYDAFSAGYNTTSIHPELHHGSGNDFKDFNSSSSDLQALAPFNGFSKRDQFTLGPLITIPKGYLDCPQDNATNITCPLCEDNNGNPISTKRDVLAPSCPFIGSPPDAYCDSNSVQKRTTKAKYMTLPWVKHFIFTYYYRCGPASNLAATAGWFVPTGILTNTCDPALSEVSPSSDGRVAGKPVGEYASEHVFEPQLFSLFMNWLSGDKIAKYSGLGAIPWPSGWTRPDVTWCGSVFGDGDPNTGFQFPAYPGDNTPASMISNVGSVTGGTDRPDLMALYYGTPNIIKGQLVSAAVPDIDGAAIDAILAKAQNTANVFQYLKDKSIRGRWYRPGNSIEVVMSQFDATFWTSNFQAGGRALRRGQQPPGVGTWGLRTLWCYWIDNHLDKADTRISNWLGLLHTKLQQSANAKAFGFLNGPLMQQGGIISTTYMQFPKLNPGSPLPGRGSKQSTSSRYGMWGDISDAAGAGREQRNNYGPLGL